MVAIVHDQVTLDRIQGVIRELQLDDELSFEATLDAALRRIHEGLNPRVLVIDLSEFTGADLRTERGARGRRRRSEGPGARHGQRCRPVSRYARRRRDRLPGQAAQAASNSRRCSRRTPAGGGTGGLGQVIAFIGSRGGVGTTTAAVSFAWLLAEEHKESTALVDLDLHFGTVALKLDTDPGNGLVRGAGTALPHRQPVHRAGDDQGDRQTAHPRRRGGGC